MNQRLQLGAMALEGVTVVFEAPEAPGRRGNQSHGVPQSQGLDGVGTITVYAILMVCHGSHLQKPQSC